MQGHDLRTGAVPTGPPLSAKKRSYPHTGLACIDRLRAGWVRFHEERRWLFERPTQSRTSPSILKYTKIPRKALRGVSQKSIFKRPCQFWAINAHKMAPRTTQRLQERPWSAPTKGLLWILLSRRTGPTSPRPPPTQPRTPSVVSGFCVTRYGTLRHTAADTEGL